MRSFVQSVKSFFRGKKTDDEEEDEEQVEEKEKKKFTMSCKRKKMKKPLPNKKKSTEVVQKTTPPAKKQSTQASARSQPSTRTLKSISKSPDTAKSPDKTRNVSVRLEKKKSSENSQYAELPKSTTTRPVQSRPFDNSSRGSNESTSSLRKIKEFSARALRKVKTFVSRPVKQSTLKKVADRVEQRKKLEQKQTSHPLIHGEDIFPKQKAPAPKRKTSMRSDVFPPVQSEAVEKNIVKVGTLPSGTVLVKNNDNDGQLFVEGRRGAMCPFWTATRRPTDEDMLDSDTEDDLQLNADVVLDVMNGRVKLVDMPTERDKLFFNRDILFGNTVRTMINLSDQDSMRTVSKRRRAEVEKLNVTEPKEYLTYKVVSDCTQFRRETFCTSKKSN